MLLLQCKVASSFGVNPFTVVTLATIQLLRFLGLEHGKLGALSAIFSRPRFIQLSSILVLLRTVTRTARYHKIFLPNQVRRRCLDANIDVDNKSSF